METASQSPEDAQGDLSTRQILSTFGKHLNQIIKCYDALCHLHLAVLLIAKGAEDGMFAGTS